MLIKQILLGVLVLSVFALLLTGVWYGTRITQLSLHTVEVFGGETISHELVRRQVLTQLEGEYAGFIPRRFAWLYPEQDIVASVNDIPRVHNVRVSRVDGTALSVRFDEYVPFALWCESLESTDCVFIDTDGYAFAKAPSLKGGALLRFSHITSKPVVGTTTLAVSEVHAATELVERLADAGWDIYHVEFDSVGDAFLHVVDGGEFKVTILEDPAETIENLQVILASPEFSHLQPGNFAYVDLRFGNKVFVNENLATPDAEAASSLFEAEDAEMVRVDE